MSMTSIGAWNEYMLTFLSELCETFPECPELIAAQNAAELMMEEDEDAVMNEFVEQVEPHTEALTQMDEKFLLNSNIEFLTRLNIAQYWTPDLEPETKQSVWQYLQTLLVMGRTIQSVPPEMLRMLENYASQMTSKVERGEVEESSLSMQSLGLGALQHLRGSTAPGQFEQMFGSPSGVGTGATPSGAATASGASVRGVAQQKNSAPRATQSSQSTQSAQPTQSTGATPVGFDALQNMIQGNSNMQSVFSNPGLGNVFADHQQRVNIQQNGPIPYPSGFGYGQQKPQQPPLRK
jgi:hypothetical protein